MLGSDARLFGVRGRIVLLVIAAAALVLPPLSGPAHAGSRGECITLEVEAPIVLPDGAVYPAGALKLCLTRSLSPVASLHTTYVAGLPVAMLASRRSSSEGGEQLLPRAMFSRTSEGRLELIGYVLPDGGRSVTYYLNEGKKPMRRKARATDVASSAPAKDSATEPESFVMVAARTPR